MCGERAPFIIWVFPALLAARAGRTGWTPSLRLHGPRPTRTVEFAACAAQLTEPNWLTLRFGNAELKFRMAIDTVYLLTRAYSIQGILLVIPPHNSCRRETEIQTDKLMRMVIEFHDRFTFSQMAPTPRFESRSLRKRAGVEMLALDQQAKLMHRIFLKMMEEDFLTKQPETPRKNIRAFLRWMNGLLEQKLYEVAQELKKQIQAVDAGTVRHVSMLTAFEAVFCPPSPPQLSA